MLMGMIKLLQMKCQGVAKMTKHHQPGNYTKLNDNLVCSYQAILFGSEEFNGEANKP